MKTPDEHARWRELAHDELQRRQLAKWGGIDPRDRLLAILDEMSTRLGEDPDWRPPSPAEAEADLAEIERWLDERAYTGGTLVC
jgi:hypothetical protein